MEIYFLKCIPKHITTLQVKRYNITINLETQESTNQFLPNLKDTLMKHAHTITQTPWTILYHLRFSSMAI